MANIQEQRQKLEAKLKEMAEEGVMKTLLPRKRWLLTHLMRKKI